jgi:uncharacterized coiled-coil protein SlyX
MSDEELKKLIESNAKAIQALADSVAQDRKEWRRDRRQMFEWMSRLAAAQADFYESQADIDERLAEILDRLTPKSE